MMQEMDSPCPSVTKISVSDTKANVRQILTCSFSKEISGHLFCLDSRSPILNKEESRRKKVWEEMLGKGCLCLLSNRAARKTRDVE